MVFNFESLERFGINFKHLKITASRDGSGNLRLRMTERSHLHACTFHFMYFHLITLLLSCIHSCYVVFIKIYIPLSDFKEKEAVEKSAPFIYNRLHLLTFI